MADGAGVRFAVDRAAVPMRPGVREVCDALAIDPWAATSCGSLLLAVDPAGVDTVRTALAARDTPVAEIGRVEATAGDGEVLVDGDRLEHPNTDPSWAAYAALAGETTE